jgi:hypothetical protein
MNVLFPIASCGCDTWSVTLRKEQRLRVYKKKALRRIFRPRRKERIAGLSKVHNEELHN